MTKSKNSVLAISLSLLLLLGVTLSSKNVYAHTFSGDESASFLALVEVIRVHLQLAKSDLATNATLSQEHAEHAAAHLDDDIIKEIAERNERLARDLPASLNELHESLEGGNFTAADIDQEIATINDLLDETVTVRVESTQLTNSTVQALMVADLVDEILESYNAAYGIEGEHEEDSTHMSEMNEAEASMEMSNSTDANQTAIVNMAAYDSALALTIRVQELFDSKIKAMAEANATQAINDLDAGLKHLRQAIEEKASHNEVDLIVHSEVHPNLQKAYNLQIIPEFPLPLLMVVSALGGIVVATRLGILRRK